MTEPVLIQAIEEITPEWLTTVLKNQGCLTQGKVIRVHTQVASFQGATSQLIHLHVDCSGEAPASVPRLFLLKIAHAAFPEKSLFQKEVQFYQLSSSGAMNLPVPQCYDAVHDPKTGNAHILLEDLSQTHKAGEWYVPPSRSQCYEAIEVLAQIHSQFWKHPELGKVVGTWPQENEFINTLTYSHLEQHLPHFFHALADRLSSNQCQLIETVMDQFPALAWKHLQADEGITLIHGDPHYGNFLFPNASSRSSIVLIDWQVWGVGIHALDLAFMLGYWRAIFQTSGEMELIQHYYQHLRHFGITDYSWDTCWNLFRFYTMRNLLIPIGLHAIGIPTEGWSSWLEQGFAAFQELRCETLLLKAV